MSREAILELMTSAPQYTRIEMPILWKAVTLELDDLEHLAADLTRLTESGSGP